MYLGSYLQAIWLNETLDTPQQSTMGLKNLFG